MKVYAGKFEKLVYTLFSEQEYGEGLVGFSEEQIPEKLFKRYLAAAREFDFVQDQLEEFIKGGK